MTTLPQTASTAESASPWFVAVVRSRACFAVRDRLQRQLEVYVPSVAVKRKSGTIDLPLLGNYLFCRPNSRAEQDTVLRDPGVCHWISFTGGGPASIPDKEIEVLRNALVCKSDADAKYQPADLVRVIAGPCGGKEARVVSSRKNMTRVVFTTPMQGHQSVELPTADIEPVS